MSVTAICPKCSFSAQVPDDAIGKKARCKKCSNTFVVEATEPVKVGIKVGAKSSPGARPKTVPVSRPATQSAPHHKKPQKSHATLWILLILCVIGVGGAGAAVFFVLQQPDNQPHAKQKSKKKEEQVAKIDEKKPKSGPAVVKNDPSSPSAKSGPRPRVDSGPTGDFKSTAVVTLAPLIKSAVIEGIPDISAVREVFPVNNKPTRVGVRITDKGESYFEMYDLEQGARLGNKFKLPKNVQFIDVDPDGTTVAISDNELRFNFVDVMSGAFAFDDDWFPYDNRKDESRFLERDPKKVAMFRLVAKDQLIVMTTNNDGDLWDWSKRDKGVITKFPALEHTEYRQDTITPRDVALSPDRSLLAFAADDGIVFREVKSGNKVGSTQKLSKYGGKVEVLGMGIDGGNSQLVVYFATNKEGRVHHLARFKVPSGEAIGEAEAVADPGEYHDVAPVNDDLFMAFEIPSSQKAKGRVGNLRDPKGKTLAVCGFLRDHGVFALGVMNKKVAFVFEGAKEKPTLGLAEIPVPGPTVPVPSTPSSPATTPVTPSGTGLLDILKTNKSPPATTNKEEKREERPRIFERQEQWEFNSQGVVKKGERQYEVKSS
jgi:hypothetical protein